MRRRLKEIALEPYSTDYYGIFIGLQHPLRLHQCQFSGVSGAQVDIGVPHRVSLPSKDLRFRKRYMCFLPGLRPGRECPFVLEQVDVVAERASEIDAASVAIRRDDRHHAAGWRRRAQLAGCQLDGKLGPGSGAVRDQGRRLAENFRKKKRVKSAPGIEPGVFRVEAMVRRNEAQASKCNDLSMFIESKVCRREFEQKLVDAFRWKVAPDAELLARHRHAATKQSEELDTQSLQFRSILCQNAPPQVNVERLAAGVRIQSARCGLRVIGAPCEALFIT